MDKLSIYSNIRIGVAVRVYHLGKTFIGICLSKNNARKSLLLRNVVDGFGIEYRVDVLSKSVKSIEIVLGVSRKTSKKKLYTLRKNKMKHVR